MAVTKKIEARTVNFIKEYERLSAENKLPSNVALAGILGIKSKSSISEILAKRQNIQPDAWQRFVAHFELPYQVENSEVSELQEAKQDYVVQRRNHKNTHSKQVPMYDGYTTLGNIQVYDDEKIKHKVVAQLPPEIFPGCDYAEKAKGNSMYPYIMNQAVLVGKTCTMAAVVYGEVYNVKTKDGLDTTKYLHPGSKEGHIKLVAYNKNIPDQEIPIADINFAYRVHFIINPT